MNCNEALFNVQKEPVLVVEGNNDYYKKACKAKMLSAERAERLGLMRHENSH